MTSSVPRARTHFTTVWAGRTGVPSAAISVEIACAGAGPAPARLVEQLTIKKHEENGPVMGNTVG